MDRRKKVFYKIQKICSGVCPKWPLNKQFVIDSKGKKTGVIISLKQYEKLFEDLYDLAVIAERRGEEPSVLKKCSND
jgi:hypothetical protein